MANKLYAKARRKFLRGEMAWKESGGDAFRVLLVDLAQYTPNLDNNEFLSSIPLAARIGNLGKHTLSDFPQLIIHDLPDGVADADDFSFTSIPGGLVLGALVIVRDMGDADTSDLVHFGDGHTGIPVTTNGADITVQWDAGENRIFKL